MENKTKKTLKSLLYGIPLAVASFFPMNKADGQMNQFKNSNRFFLSKYEEKMEKPNALYLGIQLVNQPAQGFSIGYSRKITKTTPKLGAYISLARGKYKSLFDLYTNGSECSHVVYTNISMGGMIHTRKNHTGSSAFVSLGPSYNFLDKKHYVPGTIDEKAFRKLSFEGGAGAIFPNNFIVGFKFNPLLGQSDLYGAFQFGHH